MCAHGLDKVDGSEDPSVETSAHNALGARRRGARIFFGVIAPCADKVYLVGSFNDWSEVHPLTNIGGIWQTELPFDEISDGDPYKYKIYRGAECIYLTDPCAVETDGAPYFNSVYRDIEEVEFDKEAHVGCFDHPLNIYELRADRWILAEDGAPLEYSLLAKELLPYVLQMGYTHINLSGIFGEYYDHSERRLKEACFAPSAEQGGIESFREFVRIMHGYDIGVLIDWHTEGFFGDADADVLFYKDNALYWIDEYGIDGLMLNRSGKYGSDFFNKLIRSVKSERPEAYFVARAIDGACIECADVFVHECSEDPSVNDIGDDDRLRVRAAVMIGILLGERKMLTGMGCETGGDAAETSYFDKALTENPRNARFQHFCSELNYIYLDHPCLSACGGCRAPVRTYDDGLVKILRGGCENESHIAVADMSGYGCEMCIAEDGEWCKLLDSERLIFGSAGAILQEVCGKTYIKLPPYGSAVLKRIK